MQRKLLGDAHPDLATGLNNLATVLHLQGKYSQVEPLFQQALLIKQMSLGNNHPEVASSLINLASYFLWVGRLDQVTPWLRQAAAIRETQLRAAQSETRMQALVDEFRLEEELLYGLLLSEHGHDVDSLALSVALLRKGRVAEAGAAANRLLHRQLERPQLSADYAKWQAVRAERESLVFNGPGTRKLIAYQARLLALTLSAEALEHKLAAALPELSVLQPPGLDEIVPAVANRLPKNAVLIEILWTQPQSRGEQAEAQVGPPHYVALLLFPNQQIVSVDLGETSHLDAAVENLRAALSSPTSQPKTFAQTLYKKLFTPLLPHLKSTTKLFLSLDGVLQLVPFDALHDETDYLLGRYEFHYLTSGRDLLRRTSQKAVSASLIVANPAFGNRKPGTPGDTEQKTQGLYQQLEFLAPLPGTQREAKVLGAVLKVKPLLGEQATESAVRAIRSPRILHIVTHGLFWGEPAISAGEGQKDRRALLPLPQTTSSTSQISPVVTPSFQSNAAGASSRSALAMAQAVGGNEEEDSRKDGLLTADEARSLDLEGTQFVVLSACETGKGVVSRGQGVYGLRRAFLIAGAETVVTSLWRVSDEATGELMSMYYRKLLHRKHPRGRLRAMIDAMQTLRKQPERSHPYYWAPFLVIGQDGPIKKIRTDR